MRRRRVRLPFPPRPLQDFIQYSADFLENALDSKFAKIIEYSKYNEILYSCIWFICIIYIRKILRISNSLIQGTRWKLRRSRMRESLRL